MKREAMSLDGQPIAGFRSRGQPKPEPSAREAAHTDHPLRDWDRTCPACVAEAAQPEPKESP